MTRFFLLLLFLTSFMYAHEKVQQNFIQDPFNSSHQIEFFSLKPEGEGLFPVLFLLHGHQPPEASLGGKQLVNLSYLDIFVREGIIAISISIPGFGNSDGPRDFSGPDSQKAVAAVIRHVSQFSYVDPARLGIYGISKGATLASCIHSYAPLLLQVLEGGWYDLTTLALMPNYLNGIIENVARETDGSEESLKARSALFHTDSIHCKTLITLGEYDDRRTLSSSISLHHKLLTQNQESTLKIFKDELHVLSMNKWDTLIPFVRKHFFGLYGIGIKVSLIMPALQINAVHPDTPAARSGRLKIGDVILKMSPQNDEEEIDLLRMEVPQFVALVLGKKGTSLRLHVQHFDQTYEDIILERG